MKRIQFPVAIGLAVLLVPMFAKAADEQSGQQAKTFEKQISVKLDYLLFLPEGYSNDSDKKWPLMLFLHGAGERGSDVNKVKVHGPPKIVQNKKDFPFILVSPQCPANSWWKPYELTALLDQIQKDYKVDPDRVYLTGLSMGGYGTYHLALAHPTRFAAAVVVCGGLLPHETTTAVQQSPLTAGAADPYAFTAHALRKLPIWIFHGDADPVIPVAESRRMAEELRREGADVHYTEFPGVGHNSWDRAYGDETLWKWLFTHSSANAQAALRP